MSDRVLRDRAFSVSGGAVRKARRVDGRDDLREMHVEPTGHGDISISLPATTDCGASDAICTADGRPLDELAIRHGGRSGGHLGGRRTS